MISTAKVLATLPNVTDVSTGQTLTITSISKNEIERRVLAEGPDAPCIVTTAAEAKGTIARKLIKLVDRHVNTNSELQIESPYDVTAHIVVTYDTRYTTKEDLEAAIAKLLSFCTSAEAGSNGFRNIVRVVLGEL